MLAPPLCPYMEKKGEEGLQHTVGGGVCWLRPFDHIWGDEGRRGFIALWVGGCADSTPLTIYGKICWGGGRRGFVALWVEGCAGSTPLPLYGETRGGGASSQCGWCDDSAPLPIYGEMRGGGTLSHCGWRDVLAPPLCPYMATLQGCGWGFMLGGVGSSCNPIYAHIWLLQEVGGACIQRGQR